MRFVRGVVALAFAAGVIVPAAQAEAIQAGAAVRINSDLPVDGDVLSGVAIAPNSQRVVYIADQDANNQMEVYSAPIGGGGAPVQLNDPLTATQDVASFVITADSSRVVYRVVDATPLGPATLHSVPIGGGSVTRLDETSAPSSAVTDYVVSPDGLRVVFEELTQGVVPGPATGQWRSVPTAGGSVVSVVPPVPFIAQMVGRPVFTPDSQRVVVRGEITTDGVSDLWSYPAAGGPGVRLNPDLVAGGNVTQVQVTADSGTAVYVADQLTDGVEELFAVSVTGGPADRINAGLVMGGDVSGFTLAPDSANVVYRADQDVDDTAEIYVVPVSGGLATQLNGAFVAGGNVGDMLISPDSSRVVYGADELVDNRTELFSVPLTGGSRIRLNPELPAGGAVAPGALITPDGTKVVYAAEQDADGLTEMFSVPVAGGPSVQVSHALGAGEIVFPFFIRQVSNHSALALVPVQLSTNPFVTVAVHVAPVRGGTVARVSPPLPHGRRGTGGPHLRRLHPRRLRRRPEHPGCR